MFMFQCIVVAAFVAGEASKRERNLAASKSAPLQVCKKAQHADG